MTNRYKESNLRKGRYSALNHYYFITFSTYQRTQLFSCFYTGRKVVGALKKSQEMGFTHSLAWVVMPDHVHWLLQLKKESISLVVRRVKADVSRALACNIQRPIWQKGFYDRALRKEDDVKEIARYIVANPLRSGLVDRVGDYPLWDADWL